MFFKHFTSKNQPPGSYINERLVEIELKQPALVMYQH